jgi:poly [ADP-ribose] polymerase
MAHVIEQAASGRAKCRGCSQPIAAGQLRFGERVPNPFAEGDLTHWFHLECAAYKRPEPFLETLKARGEPLEDRERLEAEAARGVAHARLPRIDGAQRAPSGRAQCRSCREPIAKGEWRIALVYYEDERFQPSGSIHVRCAPSYFETADVLGRLKRFSPGLGEEDLKEIGAELAAPQAG